MCKKGRKDEVVCFYFSTVAWFLNPSNNPRNSGPKANAAYGLRNGSIRVVCSLFLAAGMKCSACSHNMKHPVSVPQPDISSLCSLSDITSVSTDNIKTRTSVSYLHYPIMIWSCIFPCVVMSQTFSFVTIFSVFIPPSYKQSLSGLDFLIYLTLFKSSLVLLICHTSTDYPFGILLYLW
jgi:hypothetical protein